MKRGDFQYKYIHATAGLCSVLLLYVYVLVLFLIQLMYIKCPCINSLNIQKLYLLFYNLQFSVCFISQKKSVSI